MRTEIRLGFYGLEVDNINGQDLLYNGALIILNIFLSRWYAHQGKLEDVINACATSIIVSLMMILIKMG